MPAVDSKALSDGTRSIAEVIGGSIKNAISTRFKKDLNESEIDALGEANSRLIIKLGKRGSQAQIHALTEIASEAVENDDEFVIRTLSGDRIKRDQLLLSRPYTQAGNNLLLNYNQAWDECSSFLDDV